MYFVDPYAEMRLYKVKQERLAQRLELLRVLGTHASNGNAVARLAHSLASVARRIRGGAPLAASAPTPFSQSRPATSSGCDDLAA
jgi:hypothetical protein